MGRFFGKDDKDDTTGEQRSRARAAARAGDRAARQQQETQPRAQETESQPRPEANREGGSADPQATPEERDPHLERDYAQAKRDGSPDDEYQWHTGAQRPTGVPDAVEFVEVHKAFGRNKILRGLNMGIPEGKISMILGPSGTGKSVCIKHMVGLLYPDDGDVLVHGESVPNMADDDLFEMRKKFGVLFQDGALFGSMNLFDNVCFPLRQHTDKGEDEIHGHRRRGACARSASRARTTRCPTSSRAACASAPASPARSCSTPTSCSSTSPTPASTRSAPRCCAS